MMDDLNIGALPVCDGTNRVGMPADRDRPTARKRDARSNSNWKGGRFQSIVHSNVAGIQGPRTALVDWLDSMGFIEADPDTVWTHPDVARGGKAMTTVAEGAHRDRM
ncbi:hypothetical protein [Paraburkholderia sp. SIMBA_054]|uniref:hypothetical protein n=1 Tax=Paraburkholderia TaxID=1822464 RepID=UPI00397E237B